MKQLTIEQIIKILSKNKIIFKAEICNQGQDTNYNEIEFTLQDDRFCGFTYYLDENNISSDKDGITSEEELFKVIDTNREMYTNPLVL